ncbi:hypothetical protein [Streptomyces ochraceiscleroticus]|uniref:SnoaL-like domain-containing protein n=1 Tax=Streptomyces ochraceiscleroticus TaxID=47761 RepID=A0ABW1MDD0_9ACTN|nr:hypothetical protein [Streptomyces ochraceiscleroticus]
MRSSRPARRRTAVIGTAVAALLATSAAIPAFGAGTAPPPVRPAAQAAVQPVRDGSPESTVDRVADFYGAYIDAVYDEDGRLAGELRNHYLRADLRKRLAVWEEKNHADGVLRAQNVPAKWSVNYDGSGTGSAYTIVTLTWDSGSHPSTTRLAVRSSLETRQITDIKAAPAR